MAQTLEIKNLDFPYPEIAEALAPHRNKTMHAVEFIVETDGPSPLVTILYPGKKVNARPPPKKIAWANLYDFAVQPYENGVKLDMSQFTFESMIDDFYLHKRSSEAYWSQIESLYEKNIIDKEPPSLSGINAKLYLLVLKWIWIQEDFRYKYDWKEVKSRIRYTRVSKGGHSIGRGAGRAKFFAAITLLHNRLFSLEEVKKIIPPY